MDHEEEGEEEAKKRGENLPRNMSLFLFLQKWEDGMCAISFLRSARLPNSRHCSSQDLPHNFCHKGLCTNVPLVQKEKKDGRSYLWHFFSYSTLARCSQKHKIKIMGAATKHVCRWESASRMFFPLFSRCIGRREEKNLIFFFGDETLKGKKRFSRSRPW